jgi:hypothetical protein
MQGYGYSIWLIPINWREIKREYSLDFIPHITIQTNMPFIFSGLLTKDSFFVDNFSSGEILPKSYPQDPLHAYGYNCSIKGIFLLHQTHMTLYYSPNPIKYVDTFSKLKLPPKSLECTLYAIDTRSLNPSKWKIIY